MRNNSAVRVILVAAAIGCFAIAPVVQTQLANLKYDKIPLLPFDCAEGHFHVLFPKPTDEVKSYADIDSALNSHWEWAGRTATPAVVQGPKPVLHYWISEQTDGAYAVAYQDHPELIGHLNDVTKALDYTLTCSINKMFKVALKGQGGTIVIKTQQDKNIDGKYPLRTMQGFVNGVLPHTVEVGKDFEKVRFVTGRTGGDIDFRVCALAVKDHAYMMIAVGDRMFVNSSTTDRFLNSLKFD